MKNYVYEIRSITNPLLPFVYRPKVTLSARDSPPNWHNEIELLYCIGGSGYIKCGMDTYDVSEGDIFIANANMPHAVCSHSTIVYRYLIIDNSFCKENGVPIGTYRFQKLLRDSELRALFDSIVHAYTTLDHSPMAIADIRHGVLGLLRYLCTKCTTDAQAEAPGVSGEHVKKALHYIRINLSSHISLDAVAGYVGISKFHLSREFKSFTGKTVVGMINLIRCTEAKRLIEGGMQVGAAAHFCGFENLSYFSRTYKKLFNSLPSSGKVSKD